MEESNIDIRPSNADDVASLLRIMQIVWPQQTFDLAAVTFGLAQPDHKALVAVDQQKTVVGFVDGFLTESQDGRTRWEVDLLAVHPAYHGQGIGHRLVAANTEQGKLCGAEIARALTAHHNTPAHRAFQKCGYETDRQAHTLLISTGSTAHEASPVANAHYVYVNTLNYRGIWVEGEISPYSLRAAQVLCLSDQLDVAGVLIPAQAEALILEAQALGYETVGDYIWQHRELIQMKMNV